MLMRFVPKGAAASKLAIVRVQLPDVGLQADVGWLFGVTRQHLYLRGREHL